LQRTSGGTNGQLLQLTIEQLLTLQVDRAGAVTIANAGSIPVTFDGYSIISPFGSLAGTWNSLTDQSEPGWLEAAQTATDLSELHPGAGGLTLNGGQNRTLGTPYEPVFPAFGVDPDNVQFEYSTNGQVRTGIVEFSGTKVHNNLIVTVNPVTGQAQLKNDSPFTVSIDAYEIESASGSLRPANGQWLSLDDQGVTGWDEANPTTFFLSETNADGSLMLAPGQSFSLGTPYNTAGTQDLEFRFFLAGLGDFNGDGMVDAADYVVWRKTDGSDAGYDLWQANFGMAGGGAEELSDGVVVYGPISGSGSLATVPEPSALGLLMLAALMVLGVNIRCLRAQCDTRLG
jgi:hypothetical protein